MVRQGGGIKKIQTCLQLLPKSAVASILTLESTVLVSRDTQK